MLEHFFCPMTAQECLEKYYTKTTSMGLYIVSSITKVLEYGRAKETWEGAWGGTWRHRVQQTDGKGEADQYSSGNKVEKVIYLTLICCSSSRARPVSLLLTFKPEYTHKRRGSPLTGVNYGSKKVAVPLSLSGAYMVKVIKKCEHEQS